MTVAELRKALEGLPDDMEIKLYDAEGPSGWIKNIWIHCNWDTRKRRLIEYLVLDAGPI
jgi:hypothetical protein